MTDIGVVVADAWQGQGVGSALVRALITRAQARGVTSIEMDVLPSNHRVLAMIKGHWPAARTGHSGDYNTICAQLPHRPSTDSDPSMSSRTTEVVYRREPRPVFTTGAEVMVAGRL